MRRRTFVVSAIGSLAIGAARAGLEHGRTIPLAEDRPHRICAPPNRMTADIRARMACSGIIVSRAGGPMPHVLSWYQIMAKGGRPWSSSASNPVIS
jgi:hypothetical protein